MVFPLLQKEVAIEWVKSGILLLKKRPLAGQEAASRRMSDFESEK